MNISTTDPVAAHVKDLQLLPHPEGGFYRQTFLAQECIDSNSVPRSILSAIYYLLPPGGYSKFHRIDADEMWHFYDGSPLTILELRPGEGHKETVLGRGPGQCFQYVVPKGTWFGARASQEGFSLVGCTVAPAFLFDHFEIGSVEDLAEEFPQSREVIRELAGSA